MGTGESGTWTARRRFVETMRYGRPDRVPYFEEGLRDEVLSQWHEQGLADEADLWARCPVDRREQLPVDLSPRPALDGPVTTAADLKALRERLDGDDPGRFPDDWARRVEAWRTRDHVLQWPVHSGFFLSMGVHDWRRFLEVVHLLHDAPELVAGVMEAHGRFLARLADRVLREVDVDFATFSEPIGGNDRPLLSPRAYERFVLGSYAPLMDALRRGGVETILFVTYANARVLLPGVLAAGFDGVWACEAETGAMDYRSLRRQFGSSLRLIGGIDLDTLLADKATIRREIEAKVPPLLAQGGYVPLADGRVRANVPLENYLYYRRVLEEVASRQGG